MKFCVRCGERFEDDLLIAKEIEIYGDILYCVCRYCHQGGGIEGI